MPTPEEIKEYVDNALNEWCTENLQIVEPWHQVVEDLSFIAANAIQELSKDYCIVPKERVDTIYAEAATQPDGPLSSEDFINLGMRAAINKIFGNG